MSMKQLTRRALWTMAVFGGLAGAHYVIAGKPPPTPPPPTPIHYEIHYFTPPNAGGRFNATFAMNDAGVMVGDYFMPNTTIWHGFIYDHINHPGQALDLNDLVVVPAGWFITRGISINNRGAILAIVEREGRTVFEYEMRGILIDTFGKPFPTSPATRWPATWIPVPTSWPAWALTTPPRICYGRSINDNGDLLGVFSDGTQHGVFICSAGLYGGEPEVLPFTTFVYNSLSARLNNPSADGKLRVVGLLGDANGTVYRYTVQDEYLQKFPGLSSVHAINGHGEFCGRANPPRANYSLPFRYNPDLQSSPTFLGNKTDQAGGIASDINDSRDVVIYAAGSAGQFLYHNEKGMLKLDDLVVGSNADVAYWLASNWGMGYLTERVTVQGVNTSFPCIGIQNQDFGCLLVPVP